MVNLSADRLRREPNVAMIRRYRVDAQGLLQNYLLRE
jgi:hypothetical protein